jgi:hypothetical protein
LKYLFVVFGFFSGGLGNLLKGEVFGQVDIVGIVFGRAGARSRLYLGWEIDVRERRELG